MTVFGVIPSCRLWHLIPSMDYDMELNELNYQGVCAIRRNWFLKTSVMLEEVP